MSCFPFGVTAAADAGRTHGDCTVLDSHMLKNVVFVTANIRDNQADLAALRQQLEHFGSRAVGIKVYFDTGISEVRDIRPLAEICRFAEEHALRVMVHCSHSPVPMPEMLHVLHRGDIVTHAFHGDENNAAEDSFAGMKAAKQRGVIIDAGFAGHIHTDFDVFRRAVKAGVLPNTISTDITKFSAYTRGGRYGMTMCMSIAQEAGIAEEDIFRAVTSAPAAALGKDGEWGHLHVGRCADIAVLDYTDEGFSLTDKAGNHIESSRGYRCVLTVSDGQIIYKD
jgi:dihydroorotase